MNQDENLELVCASVGHIAPSVAAYIAQVVLKSTMDMAWRLFLAAFRNIYSDPILGTLALSSVLCKELAETRKVSELFAVSYFIQLHACCYSIAYIAFRQI